ncbi:hypothetical protein BCR41DRAFT_368403 [Lobosporangium transversale]|uniref:Dilute domain-containing protein n=1 Tax=Lobosporangium transversale TaxID=64571 RepID=A0A1Y2GVM7_9FUNG|nr:hypothetical protein BCR41DRAFT_368403 [Lobosporangium transversale]ORZ26315.1 hypothetical protein BCR41DRAFT_368403 [Lobosporangium transversale]|eukprot:XP_021884080.1 hypothetical protein BCR41DRAFT_368403 [Lobosporangium transversale]
MNGPFQDVERLVVKQSQEATDPIPDPSPSHQSSTFDLEQLDDPQAIMAWNTTDEEKRARMSALFARAASNGDLGRLTDILDNFRDWVDINTHEEDGSTPLIYASCFGQTAAVSMLLNAGTQVDACDKFGWTALVWATNNKHEGIVRLLLEHGASPSAQTAKGRTVADFLKHDPNDTTKIAQIFQEPVSRTSFASDCTFMRANATLLDYEQFYNEISVQNSRLYPDRLENNEILSDIMMGGDRILSDQAEEEGEFDWENCLPDQMFVFSSSDIPHIIETIIVKMEPGRSRSYKPIPAYVIFLAARFAHNFSTPELLDELLDATVTAIQSTTKTDMTLNAFWISNTSSLLHFLRKDSSLRVASGIYQAQLETVLQDMVRMIILDAEKRIEPVLKPAILEHDTIVGMNEIQFQSDWAFSFWRGIASGNRMSRANKRASAPVAVFNQDLVQEPIGRMSLQMQRSPSPEQRGISPKTVTTMLSSLLFVMQIYDIHPQIIQYVVAQLLHYISCEIFNSMIQNRKYLSRSKALQARLNLSILEDWLCNNRLPSLLASHLAHVVQLLQLLQVLSQQKDLAMWIETRRKLDLLNPTQIKHVVSSYRYEVDEIQLPAEVTKYVLQVVADTEKVRRQSMSSTSGLKVPLSRRNSIIQWVSSSASDSSPSSSSSPYTDEVKDAGAVRRRSRSSASINEPIDKYDDESAKVKSSRHWLYFDVPENLGTRDENTERVFVPHIPQEIMSLLDKDAYF